MAYTNGANNVLPFMRFSRATNDNVYESIL